MAFFGQKQGVNPFEKKGDFFDFEKFFLILRKVSFLSKKSLSKTTTRNQIKKKLTFFGPKARVTPFGKMRFLGLFFVTNVSLFSHKVVVRTMQIWRSMMV